MPNWSRNGIIAMRLSSSLMSDPFLATWLEGLSMSRLIARRMIVAPSIFLALCAVMGCAESAQPLSNEKTSILDEQLIGFWEPLDDKQAQKERQKSRVQVEQSAKSKTALTVKWLDPQKKDPSATILATELGDRRYLSYGGYDEDQRREAWLLLQYEVKDASTVRLRQI